MLSYLAKSISNNGKPIEPYCGILKKGFAPEYREVIMNLIEATQLEARQQGEKNATLKMAINCLQTGLDLATTSKLTGLSLRNLKLLKKETQLHQQTLHNA